MTIRKSISFISTALLFILISSCNDNKTSEHKTVTPRPAPKIRKSPAVEGYEFTKAKDWWKTNRSDAHKTAIVLAVNRTDSVFFKKMDTVIVPKDLTGDPEAYLPFPYHVEALNEISKIIFFSYPAQVFAAYEHGELVYTGPTNMGRKADPTPKGLYYTNWKAEKTTSTFNDEWDLKWNFNIENKLGVGFHQYELPGYPASHSCLRLSETDAKYLYNWADQWILKGTDSVSAKGTPVIVFGSYNFDGPKPWLQLVNDPKALNISETQIEQLITSYRKDIMVAQAKREEFKQ